MFKCNKLLCPWCRDGDGNDNCGYQLKCFGGNIETKGNGNDKSIQAGSDDHSKNSDNHLPSSAKGFTDNKGRKCYGHHTCAQVNVTGLVVLTDEAACKAGKGI